MVEPATICLSVLSGETFEVCLPASDVEILASLSGDVKEGLSMAKVLVLKRLREQHEQKLPEKVAEALKELDFVTGCLDTASANSAFVANAAERLRLVNNNPNNTNMTDVEASGVEAWDALLHPTLGCAGLIMLFCGVPGPTSKLTKDWLRVMDEKSKTKTFTDIERPNDRMREEMPEDDQCARLSASVVHSAAELAQQFSVDISYTVVDPNDNPVPRTGAIFLRTTWAVVDPDREMSGDSCRLKEIPVRDFATDTLESMLPMPGSYSHRHTLESMLPMPGSYSNAHLHAGPWGDKMDQWCFRLLTQDGKVEVDRTATLESLGVRSGDTVTVEVAEMADEDARPFSGCSVLQQAAVRFDVCIGCPGEAARFPYWGMDSALHERCKQAKPGSFVFLKEDGVTPDLGEDSTRFFLFLQLKQNFGMESDGWGDAVNNGVKNDNLWENCSEEQAEQWANDILDSLRWDAKYSYIFRGNGTMHWGILFYTDDGGALYLLQESED